MHLTALISTKILHKYFYVNTLLAETGEILNIILFSHKETKPLGDPKIRFNDCWNQGLDSGKCLSLSFDLSQILRRSQCTDCLIRSKHRLKYFRELHPRSPPHLHMI